MKIQHATVFMHSNMNKNKTKSQCDHFKVYLRVFRNMFNLGQPLSTLPL